jgi:hypothetical protein
MITFRQRLRPSQQKMMILPLAAHGKPVRLHLAPTDRTGDRLLIQAAGRRPAQRSTKPASECLEPRPWSRQCQPIMLVLAVRVMMMVTVLVEDPGLEIHWQPS